MNFCAFHMVLDPRYLGLERFDPLFELFDRQRIKILAGKRDQRVVGGAREEFFKIHGQKR